MPGACPIPTKSPCNSPSFFPLVLNVSREVDRRCWLVVACRKKIKLGIRGQAGRIYSQGLAEPEQRLRTPASLPRKSWLADADDPAIFIRTGIEGANPWRLPQPWPPGIASWAAASCEAQLDETHCNRCVSGPCIGTAAVNPTLANNATRLDHAK